MTVDVVETLWIPLADGTRLAARLWRPADAGPVPAILEYIPYRRRDGTRTRDEPMHGAFAAQGYAAIRVDLRGSGDSDGFLDDEYLAQEQDDALEVIAWIAAQPWCSGAVGMIGKSWGGFNALQVAARRPPALKAIITVCSTDDRFGDDIHYMGGCLLNDNLWWGAIMLAFQGRPPDPAVVGPGWRERWRERLDRMPFWPALWLGHQRRDAYWRHGSVCEDWSAIQVPVFAVGGWADSYTNAIPRLLQHLTVPRLGLIGPWGHLYPQDGVPGPAIDFLGEATRWWDHWLKGIETGVMDQPMLRAYIEDSAPPATTVKATPGRWIGALRWPDPETTAQALHLTPAGLRNQPQTARLQVRSPLWTGLACGEWMGVGIAGDRPGDQRLDDGHSLTFDTAPLEEDQTVLGSPVAELTVVSDRPLAQLGVRLCDVAPDGTSRRVSYGVLNLAHRDGPATPKPLIPGQPARISLTLNACGHRFRRGHRVRLALSTGYWPTVWPAPEAATLTIHAEACRLLLPIRPDQPADAEIQFAAPVPGPQAPATRLAESRLARHAELDFMTGVATYVTEGQGGLFGEGVVRLDETGTVLDHALTRHLTVQADDPLSATAVIDQSYEISGPGWHARIETRTALRGDATDFQLDGAMRVLLDGAPFWQRDWQERIARDHL